MCNRARATVWYTFCRPSKSAPTMPVFCDLYVKPSSRYSLVRISQTSSSKTVPIRQFFAILNCKSSSRCRSCTFCRHHLQKVFRTWHFSIFSSANRAVSTVLCAFCRQLCQIEPRNRRKRRPSFSDHGSHFTRKNRVLRLRVFSPVASRVPKLLLFSTAPTLELLLLTMFLT